MILATDPDQEGETITWHLKEVLGLRDPKRVVYTEITASALRSAIATGKCGYAIALLTAPIGGIFNSSGGLFSVFGLASSTYINETRVQQPLVQLCLNS